MKSTVVALSIIIWLFHECEAKPTKSSRAQYPEGIYPKYTDTISDPTALASISIDHSSLSLTHHNSSSLSHNGYIVENCGISERDILHSLFNTVTSIGLALRDAYDGDAGEHGFRAMFKSDDATKTVISILSHMYTMHGLFGLQPARESLLRPRFACADMSSSKKYEYLKLDYDPWLRCNAAAFHTPPIHAFYAEGTAYIFLCKSFLGLEVQPTFAVSRDCPEVSRNWFIGDEDSFHQRYQIFSIINQLNRFYLGANALDAKSDPKETFDWNKCVFGLNGIESILNPTNLELYVACESLYHAGRQGCSY